MLSIIPYLIDLGKTLGHTSGVEQFSPLGLTSKMVCTLEVVIAFLISKYDRKMLYDIAHCGKLHIESRIGKNRWN